MPWDYLSSMTCMHLFACYTLFLCALSIMLSFNPVHSVLLLILTFCHASVVLILMEAEFLAIAFITIYVGAIAVLFLFVVMMLNIKDASKSKLSEIIESFLILFLSNVVFFVVIHLVEHNVFSAQIDFCWDYEFMENDSVEYDLLDTPPVSYLREEDTDFHFRNMDYLSNIGVIGQSLYNYFTPCFLMGGLLLLVAMIGAIVLTLRFNSDRRNELSYRQLSRSDNFLSFSR